MYKQEYPLFLKHAAEWTKLYANASQGNIGVDTKKAADKASSEENENNVDIPAKSANKGSSTAATGISESEKRPLGAISIKHPTKRSLKRKQPVSEPENDIHSDKR